MNGNGVWSLTVQLAEVVLLFTLVLALAYVSTRFLNRRFSVFGFGRQIRLLDQLPLGSNRSVILIEVYGRVFLAGAAEGGVTLLAAIDDPAAARVLIEAAEVREANAPAFPGLSALASGSFKAKLEEMLSVLKPGPSAGDLSQPTASPEPDGPSSTIRNSLRRLREMRKKDGRDG